VSKKKILIISDQFFPSIGSAANLMTDLSEYLIKKNFEGYCPEPGNYSDIELSLINLCEKIVEDFHHKMKKLNEKKIIERWEEYSKAFEYSDFDKIKTYFTFPVTLSLFDNPIVINDEDELIKFYKQIRKNVQDGYKYSKLKKSRVVWISKNICVLDATYSRFNDNYENIFTGRGIYMYKKVGNSWQMFSMSGIKMNNKN